MYLALKKYLCGLSTLAPDFGTLGVLIIVTFIFQTSDQGSLDQAIFTFFLSSGRTIEATVQLPMILKQRKFDKAGNQGYRDNGMWLPDSLFTRPQFVGMFPVSVGSMYKMSWIETCIVLPCYATR